MMTTRPRRAEEKESVGAPLRAKASIAGQQRHMRARTGLDRNGKSGRERREPRGGFYDRDVSGAGGSQGKASLERDKPTRRAGAFVTTSLGCGGVHMLAGGPATRPCDPALNPAAAALPGRVRPTAGCRLVGCLPRPLRCVRFSSIAIRVFWTGRRRCQGCPCSYAVVAAAKPGSWSVASGLGTPPLVSKRKRDSAQVPN
jgi:hypothetical protein